MWADRCLKNVTLGLHDHAANNASHFNATVDSGTFTDTATRNGNYWVLDENGQMAAIFNFTELDGTLDSVLVYGYYDGNPAHDVYAYMWNWSSVSWVYLGTPIMENEATDQQYIWEFTAGEAADFRNDTDARFMLQHGTNGGAQTHLLYMDWVALFESEDDEGVMVEQYVNCTRDTYDTTYTYTSCPSSTTTSTSWATIFIMLALVMIGSLLAAYIPNKGLKNKKGDALRKELKL